MGKREAKTDEMPKNPAYQPVGSGQTIKVNLYFWLQALILALVTLILVFTFIGRAIAVDGESMLPTLQDKDMMLIQSIGYSPKQGDVVVLTKNSFRDGKSPIVKRVIATGGQTVDIDYAANTVTVTDRDGSSHVLNEPYLSNEPMIYPGPDSATHIEVPEGSICVFGDNRNNSTDSRRAIIGTVDERCVLGRALMVIFPLGHLGVIR